jgi:hypothetical protein
MPALPKLRVSVLAELCEQLRFASAPAARRQVEKAEGLWEIIENDASYPEDWLIFHLTGYRPELAQPAVIAGEALRADLGALVARLCGPARYKLEELDAERWLTREQLAQRWRVTARTLERQRGAGLLSRRVMGTDGRQRAVFSLAIVERFEREHREQLAQAGSFSRIDAELERRIVRRARVYRHRLGLSLSASARRIAARFGRSHEGVRRALIRHDEQASRPIFDRGGRLGEREFRLIERALRVGIGVTSIAKRLGCTQAGVRRAHTQALATRVHCVPAPVISAELDALLGPRAMGHASVRTGLGAPGEVSLVAHVASAQQLGWPDAAIERARAIAYWTLRRDAHALAEHIDPARARGAEVDACVTMLRWAARLRAELVRAEQLLLLNTISAQTGRTLLDHEPERARQLLFMCIAALSEAVERFDPSKGGRLAAPAGIEINRAVARWNAAARARNDPPGRAQRLSATPMELADWTRSVAPWQSWSEPPSRLLRGLERFDADDRALVVARFGLDGQPKTITQLARERQTTPGAISRRLAMLLARVKEKTAHRSGRL